MKKRAWRCLGEHLRVRVNDPILDEIEERRGGGGGAESGRLAGDGVWESGLVGGEWCVVCQCSAECG